MSPFAFEARCWLREKAVVLVWLILLGTGMAMVLAGGGDVPDTMFFVPFLVIYVGAGHMAASLRTGRFDFLLSRGPSLAQWCLVRFALAAAVGLSLAGLPLLVALAQGYASWAREGLGWLAVVLYWAALGAALGLRLSGGAAVLLMVGANGGLVWWLVSGCPRLLGTPQIPPAWKLLNQALVLFFFPDPVLQGFGGFQSLGPKGALLRVLLAGVLLTVTLWLAGRREIPVREEG